MCDIIMDSGIVSIFIPHHLLTKNSLRGVFNLFPVSKKMEHYEIITFEYSDPYDGTQTVSADKVVEKFMEQFRRHLNPEYYPEDEVWFMRSRMFLSYRDKTGGDKPMTVMLIGLITDELVAEINAAVARLYVKRCPDCGEEMPKKWKWPLCEVCREL